jgi:membrane-associated phospholipid phosphatase
MFARLLLATGRRFVRRPSGSAILATGGILASVAVAYAWKRPIAAFFAGGGNGLAERVAEIASAVGEGTTMTLLALAILLLGRGLRRDTVVDAMIVFGAAGAWCWLFTKTGQIVLAEQRPVEGGAMRWLAEDGHGVSGHASAAATLFFPIRDVLARRSAAALRHLIAASLLGWAVLVGWSRMRLGMHYLWNVELGLALGFLAGHNAVAAWRETRNGGHIVQ